MRLTIEKIINNAYGLSHDNGKVVLTPYTADGDVVDVTVVEDKKNLTFAKLDRVVTPSEFRIEPICKYYTICGGCDMLHIRKEHEVNVKKEWLKCDFKRDVELITGEFLHYRSRARFSSNDGTQAFKKRLSNESVEVENCPLLSGDVNKNTFMVGDKQFTIDESVFFQANREIAHKIAMYIKGNIKGESIYDFYGGVGFFSSFLEDDYNDITVIEENKNAKKFAYINLKKSRFIASSTENATKYLKIKAGTSIVDPPRVGMTPKAIKAVTTLTKSRVIYVSCDYKTQLRDIKEFEKYGFALDSVVAFNMFPRTHHLETVCILERENYNKMKSEDAK